MLTPTYAKTGAPTPSKENQPCPHCGGTGSTMVDDLHVRECPCRYYRLLREALGDLGRLQPADADRLDPSAVESDLWLTGSWALVHAVMVNTLVPWVRAGSRGMGGRFTRRAEVATDDDIVAGSLPAEEESERVSLGPLLRVPLLVLRLGTVMVPNRYAGAYVAQFVGRRSGPVWFVDGGDVGPKHRIWTPALAERLGAAGRLVLEQ